MTTVWFSSLDSEEKDLEEDPFFPMEGIIPPLFGKPKEIGFFSIDAKRNIRFDNSQMRYLVSPLRTRGIHFDLNVNLTNRFEQYVTLEKMHQILTWLLHNREKYFDFSCSHSLKSGIDFVTVRGTLALILCTPYLKGHYREQWEICASKFKGTIYFSRIDTDVDIEEDKNVSRHLELCQSWGYKFEQFMTTGTLDGICNIESETFQMEEYCIVLQNKISRYSLLYKAEIDAIIPHRFPRPGSGNTSCYTELKTSKHLQGEVHKYKFHRYKLLTWWAQSFLAGIPEIICGLRNDDGIVSNLEIFTVSTVPQKALGLWSSDACLSFCEKFLKFLKRIVIEDNPNTVYKFHYKGDDMIYCSKLTHPSSRYTVLPDWYIRGIVADL